MNYWLFILFILVIWYYRSLYVVNRDRSMQYEDIVRKQDKIIIGAAMAQQAEFKTYKYILYRALKESIMDHPTLLDDDPLTVPVEHAKVFDKDLYIQLIKVLIMNKTHIQTMDNSNIVDINREELIDAFSYRLTNRFYHNHNKTIGFRNYEDRLVGYTFQELADLMHDELYGTQ